MLSLFCQEFYYTLGISYFTQKAMSTKSQRIVNALLPWFAQNSRSLPWRGQQDPYKIWISEVMLQQTQMERGVEYYLRWMQRFPSIAAVAAAHEEDILHAWQGLGYYSRARNIHKAAKIIVQEHGGVFPSNLEHIRALPGIGPYTAGAIASIAFGYELPCIDANVERVLARLYDIDSPVKQEPAASRIRALALELAMAVPKHSIRAHNESIMEFGALICRKKPLCELCPLQSLCESHRLRIVSERPVPGKRAVITPLHVVTGVLYSAGKIFVQKRLPQGAWANLWEFPGGRIEEGESPEQAIVREFYEETGFEVTIVRKYGIIKHGYTTYRITLHCYELALQKSPASPLASSLSSPLPNPVLTAATASSWSTLQEISHLALPAAHRKLADTLEK